MVIDRLLKRLTPEVGVNIGRLSYNALIYADDIILVASTPMGLQTTTDTTADFLAQCGLVISATKSFTVAIRNVPHMKRSVVDGNAQFHGAVMVHTAGEWRPYLPSWSRAA
ncbi:Retrovirus-related Pol polyprotein from type-2 retrotransposable element R2DM [Anthophora quadrimaculata]